MLRQGVFSVEICRNLEYYGSRFRCEEERVWKDMLWLGYLTGIIIVSILFLLRKKYPKIRGNYIIITSFLITITFLVSFWGGWEINRSRHKDNDVYYNPRRGEDKDFAEEDKDEEDRDDGLEAKIDYMREDILSVEDDMESMDDSIDTLYYKMNRFENLIEEEKEYQNMQLYINGVGTIVIPVIVIFIQIYADEIKIKFSSRGNKKDNKTNNRK